MDTQLKEAIELARSGERKAAQTQLASFLDEQPGEAQGWYLLSLLVESPQKQAAYLSKTVALNPDHAKAKEQLAALQTAGTLAPTSTISSKLDAPETLIEQATGETLPDWLLEEQGTDSPTMPVLNEETLDTAVPNETLPDWLTETATISEESNTIAVEESPTVVGQTAQTDDKTDQTVDELRQQTREEPTAKPAAKKQTKTQPAAKNGATGLNIVLGILIVLAVAVTIMLALLIFS